MTIRRMIMLALASFVALLVANAPARLVGAFLPPAIGLEGLQGTVWSGSARQLVVHQRAAGELAWRVRPFRLLTGRLGIDIDSRLPDGSVSGRLALGVGGSLQVNDLRGSLPLGYVATDFPPGMIDGRVSLLIEDAELVDGWPVKVNGVVALGNLVQNVPKPTPLGTFESRFEAQPEGEPVVGQVASRSGPLNVSGTISLSADRKYRLETSVRATSETPDDLKQMLPLIGEQQPDGGYRLSYSGSAGGR